MSKEIERAVIAACLLSAGTAAHALGNAVGHCNKAYEVTITNMTYAQVLSWPRHTCRRGTCTRSVNRPVKAWQYWRKEGIRAC